MMNWANVSGNFDKEKFKGRTNYHGRKKWIFVLAIR